MSLEIPPEDDDEGVDWGIEFNIPSLKEIISGKSGPSVSYYDVDETVGKHVSFESIFARGHIKDEFTKLIANIKALGKNKKD